jgi:hypothetical protein
MESDGIWHMGCNGAASVLVTSSRPELAQRKHERRTFRQLVAQKISLLFSS